MERIAIHEAGHALAAYLVYGPDEDPLITVSIKSESGVKAHVRWNPAFRHLPGRKSLEQEIKVDFGGMVAEELEFGPACGAENDILCIHELLPGARWLRDHSPDGKEAQAYLAELKAKLREEFDTAPRRAALRALAAELLAMQEITYQHAKAIMQAEIG